MIPKHFICNTKMSRSLNRYIVQSIKQVTMIIDIDLSCFIFDTAQDAKL